jgi:hypothetical protein
MNQIDYVRKLMLRTQNRSDIGRVVLGRQQLEIATRFFSTIVLASIPIVIGFGAAEISRAMERGKLIDSLIAELTDANSQTRQDLAILALDDAISPQRCFLNQFNCKIDESREDLVTSIASLMICDLSQGVASACNAEGRPDFEYKAKTAIEIIKRRRPGTHALILSELTGRVSSLDPNATVDDCSIEAVKAKTAEILVESNILPVDTGAPPDVPPDVQPVSDAPPSIEGVRVVYIQFANDKQTAMRLQELLKGRGVSAPGIERVAGITQSDVRFSNASDRAAAERLREVVAAELGHDAIALRDLSNAGYAVPGGQFEIWLSN